PVGWNLALLVVALLAWGGLMLRQVRTGQARVASLLLAGVGGLLALLVFALAAWALYAVLGAAGAMPATWTAQAASLVAGFLLLAVVAASLLARPAVRWLGAPAVATGSLLPFALVATFTTLAMPGATYMGLVPLLAGALAGHAWLRRPVLQGGIAAIVAAALWSTYSVSSHEAIGHAGLVATTVLAGLVLLPALPVLDGLGRAQRWLVFAALAGTLLCAALAIVRPPFDAEVPRPMNLVLAGPGDRMQVFADDFATELPAAFLDDAGFAADAQEILPWMDWSAYPGRAGPTLAAPVAEVVADEVRDGRRHVRLRLQSRRDADRIGLFLPATAGATALRVRGQALPPPPDYAGDAPWRWISVIGPDADGVEVSFEADPGATIELYVIDRTHRLPSQLDGALRARDAVAVPIHGGDITLVWSPVRLGQASSFSTSAR
ncbi:MAG TPA: hypothetical protein VFM73_07265, partial [Xanthomonadaceae bacterium]|nr:hypothetical protein [Xanthomonadaceae bacterium]